MRPERHRRVVQIHGSEDESVLYDGVSGGLSYPSAPETVARWAKTTAAMPRQKRKWTRIFHSMCRDRRQRVSSTKIARGHAELWHIRGDGHLPAFNDAWRTRVLDHLLLEP